MLVSRSNVCPPAAIAAVEWSFVQQSIRRVVVVVSVARLQSAHLWPHFARLHLRMHTCCMCLLTPSLACTVQHGICCPQLKASQNSLQRRRAALRRAAPANPVRCLTGAGSKLTNSGMPQRRASPARWRLSKAPVQHSEHNLDATSRPRIEPLVGARGARRRRRRKSINNNNNNNRLTGKLLLPPLRPSHKVRAKAGDDCCTQ